MGSRLGDQKEIIIAVLLVVFLLSHPAIVTCAENKMLLNGTGIFLATGEAWTFDQGYQLEVKSVNPADNRAWVQLSLNEDILHEGIMGESETLIYSHNSEILNITLDTIYSSPAGELVTFKPVYQYLDPELPEPESNEITENEQPEENTTDIQENENSPSIPGFGVLLALTAIAIITYCRGQKNKKGK
ncbi:hypothetical protein V7O62_05110 [Methanolobus sp. ZRKC2]|uniref:hypothetical protein n=1 Tax=Methanolobus sp. ZRKC2 TaxID=3125783 RepID=UPI003248EDF3